MRRILLPCLLVAVAAAPAAAQRRPQPQLLLTIFGGLATGADLWEINRQALSRRSDPTTVDSLRLTRSLQSGLSLGAGATYFRGTNLGFTAEIAYLGHSIDNFCELAYEDPALVNPGENEAVCNDINRQDPSAVVLVFSAGAIYRVASRSFASPYVRAQAGITARSASTVEMQGQFVLGGETQSRLVLDDPKRGAVNPTAALGLGVMIPVGPGYQVRLEARDHMLLVRRATGPAPAGSLQVPPTGTRLVHSVGLLLKLDIVLEQRRGRRY
ncbi:MAG TPA: hypothetical protein VFH97_02350 [Gemmatimonadales bacterium]|nr:hypothetical protein [Gemmatimonadales bacterium]